MTPTPETPSLSELKRLRESAFYLISPVHFTDFDDTGFSETQKNFIAYAANFAVQIAERLERENAELVAILQRFVEIAEHGGSLRQVHSDAERLLAKQEQR